MTSLRCIAALLLGSLTGIVVYWVIAVVAYLSMHGIPLGNPGGPPTPADLAIHLAAAILASATAGMVTERLAPFRPMAFVAILAFSLALLAFLGFSKPASNWPAWFAAAFALTVITGGITGGLLSGKRKPKSAAA